MSATERMSLFDQLCELDAQQREIELAKLAARAPELARQLQALLAADAEDTDLLARDIEHQQPLQSRWQASQTPADFGQFHLLRELGVGGMGVVWLAQRSLAGVDSAVQLVAIKFMRAYAPELLRAFARERDALARLEHPGIARLIDAGVAPDGTPYLATEYVDGMPILAFVRTRQLELSARLSLMEALCEAVDYAHRRLLVHRDIKPSNVMVDQTSRVRLLDFGIAKALDAEPLEQTASNPLSPAYAAPEQVRGEAVSTATDVFGLGLVLFEMLTGQQPSQRRELSSRDMLHKIESETIEAPSLSIAADVAQHDPRLARSDWAKRLRGDLDAIVLKALRREPERRYPSARALAEDLQRFREGRPVQARPDSFGYRAQRLLRRHPWTSAAALLSLLAIVSLSAWALRSSVHAQAAARQAQLQAARAEKAAQQAAEVRNFLVGRLAGQANVSADLLMRDWIAQSLPLVKTELSNSPEAQVELSISLAQALLGLGQARQAITALDGAIAQLEHLHYDDALRVRAVALQARASAYFSLSELASSERDVQASLALFDQVPVQSEQLRLNRITARTTLLRLANARAQTTQALSIGLANLTDRIAVVGADSPSLAVDYHNISSTQMLLGRYDEAYVGAQKTLALLALTPGANARASNAHWTLFQIALARGDYPEARAQASGIRSLRERHLAPGHPDILVCGQFEALLSFLEAQPQAAMALAEPSFQALKAVRAQYYPSTLLLRTQLHLALERPMEAVASADEAFALAQSSTPKPTHIRRLVAVRALALARAARLYPSDSALQKRAAQALSEAQSETERLSRDDNFSPLYQGDEAIYLAATLRLAGKSAEAEHWQALGLERFARSMSPERALQRARVWVSSTHAKAP